MRTLPAGWPSPTSPNQTTPKVYLHVLDGSFPPASTQDGESLPAGWTVVADWEIACDLDAPLMPGQVNAGTNFTIATASCTIPNPRGGMLAPWRIKAERTPDSGHCELIASYDGYAGSSVFVLGKFVLDPIKGRASDPFVSLSLVQDLVRLRKPHDLPAQIAVDSGGFNTDQSPTDYVELAATNNGYAFSATADFPALIRSSYFPMNTDELTAMQTIVGANLGALFLSMDGTTVRVLDADYLLGNGTVDQTLDVLTSFEDLAWSQDPNAAVDRIEVSFVPPLYKSGVTIVSIPVGKKFNTSYDPNLGGFNWFDPKRAILLPGGGTISVTNAALGLTENALVYRLARSSGAVAVAFAVSASGIWEVNGTPGSAVAITATGNVAGQDDASVLAWGNSQEDATNTLTFDLGTQIQRYADAQDILDRIVTRVTSPTYVIEDVRVVPDIRRELGDLFFLNFPEAALKTRAMVTGIRLSGGPGGIEQTLTIAALGLTLTDFDAAWDAVSPTRNLNNFDTTWDALSPTLTIDDFDADPLRAS